jgi:hypothetical protein
LNDTPSDRRFVSLEFDNPSGHQRYSNSDLGAG